MSAAFPRSWDRNRDNSGERLHVYGQKAQSRRPSSILKVREIAIHRSGGESIFGANWKWERGTIVRPGGGREGKKGRKKKGRERASKTFMAKCADEELGSPSLRAITFLSVDYVQVSGQLLYV